MSGIVGEGAEMPLKVRPVEFQWRRCWDRCWTGEWPLLEDDGVLMIGVRRIGILRVSDEETGGRSFPARRWGVKKKVPSGWTVN